MFGHATYLILELAWALPVIALQWLVGGRTLWQRRRVLCAGLLLVTAYLVVADGIAIAAGIWVLHENRILGPRLSDVPIEEVLFFLLTDAMVMQTAVLVLGGWRLPTTYRRMVRLPHYASRAKGGE